MQAPRIWHDFAHASHNRDLSTADCGSCAIPTAISGVDPCARLRLPCSQEFNNICI